MTHPSKLGELLPPPRIGRQGAPRLLCKVEGRVTEYMRERFNARLESTGMSEADALRVALAAWLDTPLADPAVVELMREAYSAGYGAGYDTGPEDEYNASDVNEMFDQWLDVRATDVVGTEEP